MITRVYYEEIDPSTISVQTAGEYYYYANLIGVHEMFHNAYENYETDQINIRNKIIGEAIKRGDIENSIRSDKSMVAISSIKNKVILIADLK